MATGYTKGDPNKLDKAGGTMTGPLVLSGAPTVPLHAATKDYVDTRPGGGAGVPATTVVSETAFGQAAAVGAGTKYARDDHSHGTPADSVPAHAAAADPHGDRAYTDSRRTKIADTGFITTGDIVVASGGFVAIGPDLSVAAAAGDKLELSPNLLANNVGGDMQFEAATRVAAADNRYWSSGTNASRFPGGLGAWYVSTGYGCPHPARYVVQADDIVGGLVTIRFYGRMPAGSRNVLANANYPLRWWLTNLGSG